MSACMSLVVKSHTCGRCRLCELEVISQETSIPSARKSSEIAGPGLTELLICTCL